VIVGFFVLADVLLFAEDEPCILKIGATIYLPRHRYWSGFV
jgi:hypothetical protein